MRQLAKLFVVLALVAALLSAKNRNGEKLLKQGGEAESRKDYDKALEFYEKAYAADPKDPAYQMAARRIRFQAAMAHVDRGLKLRTAGNLEESLAEFQKAYATDPSLSIAEQEIKRTREVIDREKKKASAPGPASTAGDRGLTPMQKAAKDMEARAESILAIPELKPITRQLSGLKINNQPIKVLYETVGKLAGINVVFDSEIQPPPGGKSTFTVDLANTTLEEALDFLALQTRTYWKPLSANAIFVTNDNVQKRRDFEDYVVKVFYIKNYTLLQELQEISTTVRSVTEIRRAFTYGAQNAILVRGTTDQVALAEKLILDLDKPKGEVIVDVIVMQASRAKIRDLSATFMTGGAAGINVPIGYGRSAVVEDKAAGTMASPATNTLALNQLGNLSIHDFSVAVPTALVQALLSDSSTRVLQQPQLRAVDGQKASLRIGDKIPYATGSFGGGLGASVGVGVSPIVSTQFSFAEVGVNVDLVPKVQGRDEVSLHIELELSTANRSVKIGDITQPIISQKKFAQDIRLREGEVSIIGGLMEAQDSKLVAGLPGLANIPVLGALFGTHHVEKNNGELLIALIPHIVRLPDYNDANLRGVSAGSDTNVKLNYAPRPEVTPEPQPAGITPAAPSATVPPATAPVAPAALAPAAPTGARLFFNPPVLQTQLSGVVTVALQIENASDLFAAPMKLKFDPKILRLTSIKQGNLLGGDGQQITFSENTLNDSGDATVTMSRQPGFTGVTGSGALVNLTFQAIGRGSSAVTLSEVKLMNSKMLPLDAQPPALNVIVQ